MHGEPVVIEGSELLARCDPARDRPPRRRALHRPARHGAAQARDQGDPRGRVGGRAGTAGQGQPARRPSARRCSRMRLVFAGTPEVALPALDAIAGVPARAGRRRHPAGRAGRARPAAETRSPVGRWADADGVPVLQPAEPSRAGLPRAAGRARTRLLPRRRLRRARAADRARRPAARLGQPALLAAARVARRRAGAARPHGRRRGHRRDDVPARGGPRHRPGLRRAHRDDPARATRPATCSTGSPSPAPGCSSPPSTASRTAPPSAVPQPAEGVSLAPKVTVEDARVDWSLPGLARRPARPRLHARARRVDDVPRRAAEARPAARRSPAGRASRAAEPAPATSTRDRVSCRTATARARRLGDVQPAGQADDARRPTGPAAPGSEPGRAVRVTTE